MDKAILSGYICVTDVLSKPIKYADGDGTFYQEIIKSKVFRDALRGKNPSMMFNHKKVLASGDDLELYEDYVGLHYRVKISDIEVIAKALDNKLSGCSFAFKSVMQHIEERKDGRVRIIDAITLHDVSLLDIRPIYKSSVEIISIPESLRLKAEEYRKTKLKSVDLSEYQKKIDEINNQADKKEVDMTVYEKRIEALNSMIGKR